MRSSSIVLFLTVGALTACDRSQPGGDKPASSASSNLNNAAPTKGTIRLSGSSALQPLVNAAKESFETTNKSASVEVSAGGSKKGISDVASGAVDIGNSDIFAPDDLKDKLVDHKVAAIGFAVMANNGPYNAKVTALTLDQMSKIFTGAIKNWKELGGENAPIVIINRAPNSGTRTVFGNAVLGGDKFIESQTEDNSGALVTKLKQSKGAISYLALSFRDPELWIGAIKKGDKVIEATNDNIESGEYPIWSYEHMYTNGEPNPNAKAFLSYVLSPEFQTKTLPTVKGFIPVTSMKVTKDKD